MLTGTDNRNSRRFSYANKEYANESTLLDSKLFICLQVQAHTWTFKATSTEGTKEGERGEKRGERKKENGG